MTEKSQSFRDLIVWQRAHAFTLALYRTTEGFPKHEVYALTCQLRRAAVSIPSNIVEGFRRRTKADKLRFYNTAQASADWSSRLCRSTRYSLLTTRFFHEGFPQLA